MVYTICIGSNVNRKENLALARKRLSELFPNIRFSAEADTEPLFFPAAGVVCQSGGALHVRF